MSAVVSDVPPPVFRDDDLRAKSQIVEELRRRIAAESAMGVAAAPALLAEFARAHRVYLNHKIESERRNRNSGLPVPELPRTGVPTASETAPTVVVKPSSPGTCVIAPDVAVEPAVPLIEAVAVKAETVVKEEAPGTTNPIDQAIGSGRKPSTRWIWWLLLGLAAALWVWVSVNGWAGWKN